MIDLNQKELNSIDVLESHVMCYAAVGLNERQISCPVIDHVVNDTKGKISGVGVSKKGISITAANIQTKPLYNQNNYPTLEILIGQPPLKPVSLNYSEYKQLNRLGQTSILAHPKPILTKPPSSRMPRHPRDQSTGCLKKVQFASNLLMLVYDRDVTIAR